LEATKDEIDMLSFWNATAMYGVNNPIITLLSGATIIAQVWTVDRHIEVWKGDKSSGGTQLGVSSEVLIDNRNYHFEFRYKIHGSAGIVEFRTDGNSRISLASQNTGTGSMDRYKLSANGASLYVDSLRLYDGSDFPRGIERMLTLFPTGDSAASNHNQFQRSSGSPGYPLVADFSNSTYVFSTVDGQKQFFTLPAHGLPADATIINKTVRGIAKKVSGGGLIPNVRLATTDYPGSEWVLGVNEGLFVYRMMTNPAGGNWAIGDAEEIGVESNI
jgi:hypothetical protein